MLLVGLLLAGNMVALSGVQAPPALLTLMKGAAGLVLISYLIVLHYLCGHCKILCDDSASFQKCMVMGLGFFAADARAVLSERCICNPDLFSGIAFHYPARLYYLFTGSHSESYFPAIRKSQTRRALILLSSNTIR